MRRFPLAVIALVAGLLAHRTHRTLDQIRFEAGASERIFLPSADALRVASMGYHTVTADLFWVRSVLTFSEIYTKSTPDDVRWLDAMLTTVATLDPNWRTVYFHGGGMLRVCDAIEESDLLFEKGMESLPEEPYFPFSIGMNAYLYRQDLDRAAYYLDLASQLPGAPPWYASAAAGFLEEDGGRQAAIRYLHEQLEASSDPSVQRAVQRKLTMLMHEDFVDRIAERRVLFQEKFGRDIVQLSELGELPSDPLGGQWVLSPDGIIRSDVVEAQLASEAVADERWMLTVPWERFD